jgi:xanthine/CO dehydrogenase XdhC/CoxF family maturation factor
VPATRRLGWIRRHDHIYREWRLSIRYQDDGLDSGGFIMFARDEDILKAAEDWRAKGRGVALATVVETWGSAPRPVGSNLVIDEEGNFLGSVSGGCVEGAVVTEALDVIESGKPKTLEFGVADETAWKVGLSCGGTIRVFVEKVD